MKYYDPTIDNDYIFTKTHLNNEDTKDVYANMNGEEKQKYINNFKQKFGTDFSNAKEGNYYGDEVKRSKNKLYASEYTRNGEVQYLNIFCENTTTDYIDYKEQDVFRVISYNIHAFIKSCDIYVKDNNRFTDVRQMNKATDSTMDIINLLHNLKPDVVAFQEFTPSIYDNNFLRIRGFMDTYNKKKPSNVKQVMDYIISDCHEYNSTMTFFGNAILSTLPLSDKKAIKMEIGSDPRCFLGGEITYNKQSIHVYNIHPSSEAASVSNEQEIKQFFDSISTNVYNKNIIVVGDFNTSKEKIHDYIEKLGFIEVNKLLNYISDDTSSGYHGTLIDYVYVSNYFLHNFTPHQVKILKVDLSDHFPVMFDFKIKENNIIDNTYNAILIRQKNDISKVIHLNKDEILSRLHKYPYAINHIIKKAIEFGEIVNLNDKTYLFHGTSAINFNNSDIPYEIPEEQTKTHDSVPKSFTLLHFAGESFSNYYGTNDDVSLKRGIIYKIKEGYTLPVINLYKKNKFSERSTNRLSFYIELYKTIRTFLIEKKIFTPGELSESGNPFDVMRTLWILLAPIYLNITDIHSSAFNKELFYGTINTDFIYSDSTYLNNYTRHSKTSAIWGNDEVYEGLEIMIFHPLKFLEMAGVYYNGKMYSKHEWFSQSPHIVQQLKQKQIEYMKNNSMLKIPDIRDTHKFPRFYAEKYLVKYIKSYLNYIIALYNHPIYTNEEILLNSDMTLKNIFYRYHIIHSFDNNYSLNLLLHDFIDVLQNIKYIEFKTNIAMGGTRNYSSTDLGTYNHSSYSTKNSATFYISIKNYISEKITDDNQNKFTKHIKYILLGYINKFLNTNNTNNNNNEQMAGNNNNEQTGGSNNYFHKYKKYKNKYIISKNMDY